MENTATQQEAIELLQALGLKEYEARSFVALVRLPKATAKEISEHSGVPRTRIYDAIDALETKGLVEIQHSNPQVFRAVSVSEATETIGNEYEERTAKLENALGRLEPIGTDDTTTVTHDVWALSGGTAIANRTERLIDAAETELVFIIGRESVLTDALIAQLSRAQQRGVDVVVGIGDETSRTRLETALPETAVFVSALASIASSPVSADDTEIGRLLLVDHNTVLISTFHESNTTTNDDEQAVFGQGSANGLVALVRRLMATEVLSAADPSQSE